MNLPALNNTAIANAGATLCTTSIAGLATIVANLEDSGHPPYAAIVGAFVGIVVGAVMCFVGRPPAAITGSPPPTSPSNPPKTP